MDFIHFITTLHFYLTGFQYLLGWHIWRSRPPGLQFQHSALSRDIQEALCKCFCRDSLWHCCGCAAAAVCLTGLLPPQCPVNCLAWSPFSAEAFLSGSSDWTIQLWRRDQSQPVLGFISTQRAVVDVKWSPRSATVFATIKEELLEIWDLSISMWVRLRRWRVLLLSFVPTLTLIVFLTWNTCIPPAHSLDPVIVQPAAPGVKFKALLFALQTDCVLVGGSDGHVTVYKIKNLIRGENNQVNLFCFCFIKMNINYCLYSVYFKCSWVR